MAAKKQQTVKPTKQPVIAKEDFLASAKPLELKMGDTTVGYLEPRQFATGSYGFGFNGSVNLKVGDKLVGFTSSINLVVKNSAPKKEAA